MTPHLYLVNFHELQHAIVNHEEASLERFTVTQVAVYFLQALSVIVPELLASALEEPPAEIPVVGLHHPPLYGSVLLPAEIERSPSFENEQFSGEERVEMPAEGGIVLVGPSGKREHLVNEAEFPFAEDLKAHFGVGVHIVLAVEGSAGSYQLGAHEEGRGGAEKMLVSQESPAADLSPRCHRGGGRQSAAGYLVFFKAV